MADVLEGGYDVVVVGAGGGVWIPGNYALRAAGEQRHPAGDQDLPRLDRR